jgi:hypothetical protein
MDIEIIKYLSDIDVAISYIDVHLKINAILIYTNQTLR